MCLKLLIVKKYRISMRIKRNNMYIKKINFIKIIHLKYDINLK